MTDNIWQILKKYRLSVIAGLAAVTYNNWLLGPLLNHNLFAHNGSVSEYSVSSQPSHWWFQSLDIVSGILLMAVGYKLIQGLKANRAGRFLAIGLVVLGIANIWDALFSLPCSETLSRSCSIPVSLNPSNIQLPGHAYSSVVIGVCYLLLPAAALVYGWRHKLKAVLVLSFLLVSSSLISLASAIHEYAHAGALTTKTTGGGQEIQMLLVGAWLIICLLALDSQRQAGHY